MLVVKVRNFQMVSRLECSPTPVGMKLGKILVNITRRPSAARGATTTIVTSEEEKIMKGLNVQNTPQGLSFLNGWSHVHRVCVFVKGFFKLLTRVFCCFKL